jgi:ribosomal protein S18 acetylase RimI-like enzyme
MTDLHISPLAASDAEELARLHREAFPSFFLSSLGVPFLRQFYGGFAEDSSAVALVARDSSGRAVGAVVGTVEPSGYFSRLLRSRLLPFGVAAARAVLRNPRAASRLVRAVAYRGTEAAPSAGALLSSICVAPTYQGTGAGRLLLGDWERAVVERGTMAAHLTTDADANDGVNAFYQAAGWRLHDTFRTREGRLMNTYTKHLRSS